MLRRLYPDYEPKYKCPEVQYKCSMLDSLNVKEQTMPYEDNCDQIKNRLFTSDELKKLTNEQLQIEMDGYVKVRLVKNFSC